MNEPTITSCSPACVAAVRSAANGAPATRRTPVSPCYAYSPWDRFPVIGPALTVLIAIVSALALVSNANAFNDVNAELQIAAREQRLAQAEAQRVAREQAARRATLLAANERAATSARPQPAANRGQEKGARGQ